MTGGCYGLGVSGSSRVYFTNWTESLGEQRSRLRRSLLLLRVREPPVTLDSTANWGDRPRSLGRCCEVLFQRSEER